MLPLVKVKVKLGFLLYLKLLKRDQLVERTHTCIPTETGRESQIEDLAGKTKERAAGSLSFVQLGRTLTQERVEV